MTPRSNGHAVDAPRQNAASRLLGIGTPLLSIAGLASGQVELNFYDVENYPMALGVSDVTGDAAPDILTPCRDSFNDVCLLKNTGDGTFDPAQPIFSGTSPRAIATADFNNDGWVDYVICNQDQHITVFINQQDGAFARSRFAVDAPQGYQGHQPRFVKVGDLEGDGDLDLIIPLSTQDYYENWWGLTTFSNDGSGGFTQNGVQVVEGLNTVRGFDVGDLDADGDIDMALGVFDFHPCQIPYCYEYHAEGQTLAVLMNEGVGQPLTINYLDIASLVETIAVSDIALVDLDGDGQRDIAARIAHFEESVDLVSIGAAQIQTFRNLGDGAFESARLIWSRFDTRGHGMAARDFEGDGDIDFLVSTTSGFSQPAYLTLLLNAGDGITFVEQNQRLTPPRRFPLAVAMTDVSGDGQNDILTSFSEPSQVMSLINPIEHAGATLTASESIVRGALAQFDISNAPIRRGTMMKAATTTTRASMIIPSSSPRARTPARTTAAITSTASARTTPRSLTATTTWSSSTTWTKSPRSLSSGAASRVSRSARRRTEWRPGVQ